jgi:MFS transporter, Spinster family, sphingosine-1-phosphate transporter
MRIRNPHAILAVLSGLNLVNYLDRYIVAAVGPKLAEELGLSDSKFGFVVTAFMIGYFATSPIFGALGDRFPRRGLIALGVAVWSLATVGSGLTETFAAMIASRVVVGVGEASYATLAPTIIDDLAEPAKKNRWLAIFYVAIPVGSALGYLVGGELEHAFGWRSAFFIAGGPGLVLALLALAIEEPKRNLGAQDGRAPASFGATAAQLFRIPLYRDTVIGYTAQTFALGGFAAWAPKYLYRVIGLDLKTADYWFGLILVVTGLLATFVGGQLGDRWPGADRARANLRVCAISTAISVPFAALCLLSSSAFGFFAAIAAAEFAIFLSTSPINAVILGSVPSELRASAMAASIFAIHLLGDMISPPLIGVISDTSSLRKGMIVLPVALAAATLVWWRQSGQAAAVKSVQV